MNNFINMLKWNRTACMWCDPNEYAHTLHLTLKSVMNITGRGELLIDVMSTNQ